MSGDFAASQSLDLRLVNVTSRIAKPPPASWLATNCARAPRHWQTLEEVLWSCLKLFGSEKYPESRVIRGPNGHRETGQPFAAALMQRAPRLNLMRRKAEKAAAPLTETLAFRQIVQDPLVVHKPAGCLMSLVFTRGARSDPRLAGFDKVWGRPRVDIRF